MPRFTWAPCDLEQGGRAALSASALSVPTPQTGPPTVIWPPSSAPLTGPATGGSNPGILASISVEVPVETVGGGLLAQEPPPESTPERQRQHDELVAPQQQGPRPSRIPQPRAGKYTSAGRASPFEASKSPAGGHGRDQGSTVSTSDRLASTVGLVSELQLGAKGLLAELEERDCEVRLLRQTLEDLTRGESGLSRSRASEAQKLLRPMERAQERSPMAQRASQASPSNRGHLRSPPAQRGGRLAVPTAPALPGFSGDLDDSQAKLSASKAREEDLQRQVAASQARERVQQDELEQLREELRSSRGDVEHMRADVTDAGEQERLLKAELARAVSREDELRNEVLQLEQRVERGDLAERLAEQWHMKHNRTMADFDRVMLDLERHRMKAEDLPVCSAKAEREPSPMAAAFAPLVAASLTIPNCPMRSSSTSASETSLTGPESLRSGRATPDHLGARPQRKRSYGLPTSPRLEARSPQGLRRGGATPPRTPPPAQALSQAENLVLEMFSNAGSQAASRTGSRTPRSPRSNTSVQTEPPSDFGGPFFPATSLAGERSLTGSGAGTPATGHREDDGSAPPRPPSATGKKLCALNGRMPSFPAANLGSPRPSGKAERGQSARPPGGLLVPGTAQGEAERRRSCPLLGPQATGDAPMAHVRCSSRGAATDVQPGANHAGGGVNSHDREDSRDEHLEVIARSVAAAMGSPQPWADVTGGDDFFFSERPPMSSTERIVSPPLPTRIVSPPLPPRSTGDAGSRIVSPPLPHRSPLSQGRNRPAASPSMPLRDPVKLQRDW